MQDVMVDLETLGRRPGCAVLSIGAVAFDPKACKLGEEFYVVVSIESCRGAGLHVDPETLTWWEGQSDEAREVIKLAGHVNTETLSAALMMLAEYLAKFGNNVRVWGNGSDFDNAILAVCYGQLGLELPWEFWNNRCYRTLKSLRPGVRMVKREGVRHNALDDARSQALHAIELLR